MRFCQPHWDKLRTTIADRGLGDLIATDGETAVAQLTDALERREATPVNFDPLMNAHWAITANAMDLISKTGNSPLYLMLPDDVAEDPVAGYGEQYEGRTWPRCPLCYINLAHEVSCTDRRCTLDKVNGYDFFIERATDDQVVAWQRIKDGQP